MRAVRMTALLLGLLVLFGVVAGVFYFLAALLGLIAAWIFGDGWAYVGVAIGNTLHLVLGLVMIVASLLTTAERKWSSLMQDRIGPNRARLSIIPGLKNRPLGGIPHFIADGLKMATKEDVIPANVSRGLYSLAPMISFGTVLALFAVVPVAPELRASTIPGIAAIANAMGVSSAFPVSLTVAPHFNVGVLYIFAISSLAVFGTALAGWASNNKLALLGGVRAASQMISYEIALGLSLVGIMMAYGSVSLEVMTVAQNDGLFGGLLPAWGIFLQPYGLILFFVAAFAETKRAPFDSPEGESEIVGYFVEYSGMRFGLFMISEFVEIIVLSGVVAAAFLGGYHLPVPPAWGVDAWIERNWGSFALACIYGASFIAKLIVLCWLQLVIRWSFLRIRFDQIQTLGWKMLLPLALVNIVVTGVLILVDPSLNLLGTFGLIQLALLVGVTVLYQTRRPATVRFVGKHGAAPAAAPASGGH